MATTTATPREISEAHWAFIRTPPRSTNSDTSGRTANIDESPSEWDTGSRTWLYIAPPLHPRLRGRRFGHELRGFARLARILMVI